MEIQPTDALIIGDVQVDFCPGGALPVSGGDLIVPVINRLQPRFQHRFFIRDWHPANHMSFSDTPHFVDKSWPPHCVAGTPGAQFHADLDVPDGANIVNKGTDPEKEAYSAFSGTDLAERLRVRGIRRVFATGLATDYCVKSTALDARREGFEVVLVEDAVRGIDVPQGTVDAALDTMRDAGVVVIQSGDIDA
jgi:nicotinamidase/pyrazinamidase